MEAMLAYPHARISRMKMLVAMIALTPIVDVINGFMINQNLQIPIGQAYRIFMMVYLTQSIFIKEKLSLKSIGFYFLCLYYICNPVIQYFRFGENSLSNDFSFSTRIAFFLIMFAGAYRVCKTDIEPIIKGIHISSWVVPISLLIPYGLGIGKSTYLNQSGLDVGYKGLYFSNNALNVVLIILLLFTLDQLYSNQGKKRMLIVKLVLVFVSMILIGSKTSIIFSVIISFLFLVRCMKSIASFIISFLAIGSAGCAMYYAFFDKVQEIILRQQYTYEASDSFFTYLVSGRNQFFGTARDVFFNHISIATLFLGKGNYQMTMNVGRLIFGTDELPKGSEMDMVDLFFNLGVLGSLPIVMILFVAFMKSRKYIKSKGVYSWPLYYSIITVIVFSILGGHAITEALSATYFAAVIAAVWIAQNKDKKHQGDVLIK